MRRRLLDRQGKTHASDAFPLPWGFASTVYQFATYGRSSSAVIGISDAGSAISRRCWRTGKR